MYSFVCLATIQRRGNGVSFFQKTLIAKALELVRQLSMTWSWHMTETDITTGLISFFIRPNAGSPRTYMMFVVASLSPGPRWVELYFNIIMVAILYVSDYHKKDTSSKWEKLSFSNFKEETMEKWWISSPETVDNQKYSAFSGTML